MKPNVVRASYFLYTQLNKVFCKGGFNFMRDKTNYWARRASRRRFLGTGVAAGAGVAGLALVGCGDDDGGGGTSNLATPTTAAGAQPTAAPADPFANAKRGGTYHATSTGDPPTLDPYGNLSFLTKGYSAYVYSRLFKYKTGPGIDPGSIKPTPDIAQSAEASPDGLTWTIKLRSDVKFHNVAPVNGRQVTSDDVKFSWGRLTAPTTQNRSQVSFVDKIDYPDKQTVIFKLKTPNASFLDALADTNLLFVMPTESEGGFDPGKISIGSGPWISDSYQPGVKFTFKKNPGWYLAGFPLFEGVELSIIPEYANRLAQFLAGNIDVSDLNGDDLVGVKKQIPTVKLDGNNLGSLSFLYFDNDPASPWIKDERVRQAISMSLNRDDLTELGYNVKKLREAGLDVKTPYHNIIPAGATRWWLDPQGKDIGDGAKSFKYDPVEAKKLLSAAGFADGFSATYQYTANRYGKLFNDIAEANIQFMNQIGIKTTTDVQDYSSKYITQTFAGNFKGIAFGYQTPFPETGGYLMRMFGDDPLNHGRIKDAKMAKYAADQAVEMNEEKRKAIFWEAQKYHATKMYYVPNQAGAGTGWTGFQSNVNGVEYRTNGYGGPTETIPFRWKS